MQHRSTAWKEKSKILTTAVWFRLRILSLVVRQLLVSHRGGTLSSKDPVPFFRLSCSLLWRNQLGFRGNNPLCCLCPLRGQKPGCSHLAPPLLLCAKGQERCRSISCLCWPSEPPCWAEIMFPLEHMPGPHTSALPVQHLQQFWYQVTSCTFTPLWFARSVQQVEIPPQAHAMGRLSPPTQLFPLGQQIWGLLNQTCGVVWPHYARKMHKS